MIIVFIRLWNETLSQYAIVKNRESVKVVFISIIALKACFSGHPDGKRSFRELIFWDGYLLNPKIFHMFLYVFGYNFGVFWDV